VSVAGTLTEAVQSLWAIGNARGATPLRRRLTKKSGWAPTAHCRSCRVGGFARVDSDHHIVWPVPLHEFECDLSETDDARELHAVAD
jgi:hypothetical protein